MNIAVKNHPYLEYLTVSNNGDKVYYKKQQMPISFEDINVVRLPNATLPLSKIVLETFKGVPPRLSNYEIVFIDGNQLNTKPYNLTWQRKSSNKFPWKTYLESNSSNMQIPSELVFTLQELKRVASFIVSKNDANEERLRFKFGMTYTKLFQVLDVLELLEVVTAHRSNMIREVIPENLKFLKL